MTQDDLLLLSQIHRGERVFRPRDDSDAARLRFQHVVEQLRHLRDGGLVRLRDTHIVPNRQPTPGAYLMAGPCDLTDEGLMALGQRPRSRHRQLV